MRKKFFFACFCIWSETKMKWSENKTKKKQKRRGEKGWSEILGQCVKKRRKILGLVFKFFKSIPSEVKRSEENVYFVLLRRETKRKNVYFVSLWSDTKKSEDKRSETKNFWKQNKAKYAVLISLWSEAKNVKQKEAKKRKFFFVWARETHVKRISFRFVSLWSEKSFLARPAHPSWKTVSNKRHLFVFGQVQGLITILYCNVRDCQTKC